MRQPELNPITKSITAFNILDTTKRRRAERITSVIGGSVVRTPSGTTIVIDPAKAPVSPVGPTWI